MYDTMLYDHVFISHPRCLQLRASGSGKDDRGKLGIGVG